MDITVEILTKNKDLHSIAKDWNKLYQETKSSSFFSSFDYANIWYEHFSTQSKIYIFLVRKNNSLIGVLPLIKRQRNNGIRELSNLINDHCLIAPPLIADEHVEQVQSSLLQALASIRDEWDVFTNSFSYSFLSITEPFTSQQLKASGHSWHKTAEPTYCIARQASFAEYCEQTLSRRFKRNLKNLTNRLDKEKNINYFLLRDSEVVEFWPEFLELEASGWKGESKSAISCTDDSMQSYYKKLIDQLAKNNQVYLYGLSIDGTLIAAEFGYIDKDIFHQAKSAYNEQYSHLSPSNLLTLHLIEHVPSHAPQVRYFHLFPWDTGYKVRLINEDTSYTTTTIYSKNWRGFYLYQLYKLKTIIKAKLPRATIFLKKTTDRLK